MEKIIQITSGKGPDECERAVYLIFEKMKKEIARLKIQMEIIELIEGKHNDTFLSVLFKLTGDTVAQFGAEWQGTIQWIAQSPYRKAHKRKNWFAGVIIHEMSDSLDWNERDVVYQTLRASGPGGQHVNKVETAVRATHLPSGASVLASDARSQLANKKAATERLRNKLLGAQVVALNQNQQDRWMEHNSLERGNARKIFKEKMD